MNVWKKVTKCELSILRRLAMAQEKPEGGLLGPPPPARNRVKCCLPRARERTSVCCRQQLEVSSLIWIQQYFFTRLLSQLCPGLALKSHLNTCKLSALISSTSKTRLRSNWKRLWWQKGIMWVSANLRRESDAVPVFPKHGARLTLPCGVRRVFARSCGKCSRLRNYAKWILWCRLLIQKCSKMTEEKWRPRRGIYAKDTEPQSLTCPSYPTFPYYGCLHGGF